jgi:membrane-associated phospholipid phosphatase
MAVSGARPVDRLVAAYNVGLTVVWLVLIARAPQAPLYARWIGLAHLAAAGLPWLLRRGGDRLGPVSRVLRDAYPLLLIGAYWSELGLIHELLHDGANDAVIARLDLALFGAHLHDVWIRALPQLWISETMHFAYVVYYAAIFLPPLAAGLAGRGPAMRDMVFRLLVTYVGCYVIYVLFPVEGPSHTMPRYDGALTAGFFYRLMHDAVAAGDSIGTAFPSSHVAGAVTIAWLGVRWLRPWVAALLVIEAAAVVASTVYTQQHFALDSAAGVVFALALQAVVAPGLERWLGDRVPGRSAAGPPAFEPERVLVRATAGERS